MTDESESRKIISSNVAKMRKKLDFQEQHIRRLENRIAEMRLALRYAKGVEQ